MFARSFIAELCMYLEKYQLNDYPRRFKYIYSISMLDPDKSRPYYCTDVLRNERLTECGP